MEQPQLIQKYLKKNETEFESLRPLHLNKAAGHVTGRFFMPGIGDGRSNVPSVEMVIGQEMHDPALKL